MKFNMLFNKLGEFSPVRRFSPVRLTSALGAAFSIAATFGLASSHPYIAAATVFGAIAGMYYASAYEPKQAERRLLSPTGMVENPRL